MVFIAFGGGRDLLSPHYHMAWGWIKTRSAVIFRTVVAALSLPDAYFCGSDSWFVVLSLLDVTDQ